jgi:hypothetical protein
MSKYALQAIVIALASVLIAGGVLVLARRQRLSFRYAIGWMLFLGLGVVSALLLPIVQPAARQLGVTPGVIVSSLAVIALLAICIQLSVSISGLQEQVRSLAEESALLRAEVVVDSEGDDGR